MTLKQLAQDITGLQRDYWLGLITRDEAIQEVAWLDIRWQNENTVCPGFLGNSDTHPCECGDHGCCNPGMTPQEAAQVTSWPEEECE